MSESAKPPESVHPSHLSTVIEVLEDERDSLRSALATITAERDQWHAEAARIGKNYEREVCRVEALRGDRDAAVRDGRKLHDMLVAISLALNDAGWPSSALGVDDRACAFIRSHHQSPESKE